MKYFTILHRTCLYGIKHQIGCQYKPLLELKYKQVIGKKQNNTLLAYHNTEFEALVIYFVTTTQAG